MTEFDAQAAHKHFAVTGFNTAWALIDKPSRTPEEEEEMIRRAVASHYHWTQRDDYQPQHASIANWQLSRVFALCGEANLARRYGVRSLTVLQDVDDVSDFFRAYAYEAIARAEAVAGNTAERDAAIAHAEALAATLSEAHERDALADDLATLR